MVGFGLLENEKVEKYFPGTVVFAHNTMINSILGQYNTNLKELQFRLNKTGDPQSFHLEGAKMEIYLPKKVNSDNYI